MNLVKLVDKFHSEERCRNYLEALRWPDGAVCPRCGFDSVSRLEGRDQYECLDPECQYQFSVTADTVLHKTKIPLWKWFLTAYLMTESKKGISANQIHRTVGVSYKTAWYLCHRIRAAMGDVKEPQMRGQIEVDETWIGGSAKGKGSGYKGNKTIVVGMIKRGGEVRLRVIKAANQKLLHRFIKKHAAPDVAAIYTDEARAYQGVGDYDTKHETVNHSADEWVRGDAHTNSIENVWSLLKRSIMGAFHHVSKKHLPAYLDELEWRFNNRKSDWLFRDTMRKLVTSDPLSFQELTKKKKAVA